MIKLIFSFNSLFDSVAYFFLSLTILQLSKAWLRGDFQEKTIPMGMVSVRAISQKLSGSFGSYRHDWVRSSQLKGGREDSVAFNNVGHIVMRTEPGTENDSALASMMSGFSVDS